MMQGDPKIDDLMRPVNAAIRRHVKDAAAVTDIYNRAYEAVMEVQDALNVSAAVTAQQIAENAKNLQRAEAAEAKVAALQAALDAANEDAERLDKLIMDAICRQTSEIDTEAGLDAHRTHNARVKGGEG